MRRELTIESPPPDWYLPLASHLREAYLRYSFTYGTAQEVEFLYDALELEKGMRLLDVGAGPGRHAVEFAKRGIDVVAVDISPEFAAIARTRATEAGVAVSVFEMDARKLPFEDEFDAVMSVCEGAFGLGVEDLTILRGMTRALRSGRRLAVSAINVFYVLSHMKESGKFDPATMLFKEKMIVKGIEGEEEFEMWNSCFTPRELEWIANGAGLDPESVYGVSPGEYAKSTPTFDHPEILLLARKP